MRSATSKDFNIDDFVPMQPAPSWRRLGAESEFFPSLQWSKHSGHT